MRESQVHFDGNGVASIELCLQEAGFGKGHLDCRQLQIDADCIQQATKKGMRIDRVVLIFPNHHAYRQTPQDLLVLIFRRRNILATIVAELPPRHGRKNKEVEVLPEPSRPSGRLFL